MHDYLRAIGFGDLKDRSELNDILQLVATEPTAEFITDDGRDYAQGEKTREFATGLGLTVRGEYDREGRFTREYYFPYFKGNMISFTEEVIVEKEAEKESYVGVCDDMCVGMSLIFYLLNMVDYVDHFAYGKKNYFTAGVRLSGLSLSGRIILPIASSKSVSDHENIQEATRNTMLAAARAGDQDAIESLTLEDMDLYATIARRARTEDVLSIVESSFMPYGIACDQYSVMGTILVVSLMKNSYTGQEVYGLTLESNKILLDVCINAADLLGEPLPGRRFRGTIWLQGCVDFVD